MTEAEKLKIGTIVWGFVIPLLIGIAIILIPSVLRPALDAWFPPASMTTTDPGSPYAFLTVIFTHGLALMVVMGVPLFLGLSWNQWAGGAAGFVTGTLYYIAFAGYNMAENVKNFLPFVIADPSLAKTYLPNLYADPSFIGNYIIGAILIGYMAGALNKKSMHLKRMIGVGLTAALSVGAFQYILDYTVSFGAWMTRGDPWFALFTKMLPMILLGILVPVIARISAGSELSHP